MDSVDIFDSAFDGRNAQTESDSDPEKAGASKSTFNVSTDAVSLDFLTPPDSNSHIGKLGSYRVLGVVGQGAFGIVLKAFDDKLQRVVAIKCLSPNLASTSPPRKRFLREARSVASLSHENVVQIFSVEESPLPYLVMEFVDGMTLKQRLEQNGPLSLDETLDIGTQILSGLTAAHYVGLVHRDIKPDNILLANGAALRIKLTDFGLARAIDDASVTQSGVVCGTPMYMAPEQAMGKAVDQRSDLFSLGSVLYECSTGHPPFRARGAIAVMKRVIEDNPRSMSEIVPEIPDWFSAIVGKLMSKEPTERFANAESVRNLLADICDRRKRSCPITLNESHFVKAGDVTSSDIDHIEEQNATTTVSAKSRRWRYLIVAASTMFVLALIGFGLFTLYKPNSIAYELNRSGGDNKKKEMPRPVPQQVSAVGNAESVLPAFLTSDVDEVTSRSCQERWAEFLNLPLEYTNSIGIKFRLVPPGQFEMGRSLEEAETLIAKTKPDDVSFHEAIRMPSPVRQIRLTKPFYIGVHEISAEQYYKLVDGQEKLSRETESLPINDVSWFQAVEYANKLSEVEKLKPCYFLAGHVVSPTNGNGYRLPTNAEWEYACRAGSSSNFWFGDDEELLPEVGWYKLNSGGQLHSIGQLRANPFGLFDMCGNVWEWVEDGRDNEAETSAKHSVVDPPRSINGSRRIMRGSSYVHSALESRSASFASTTPDNHNPYIGFRLSLSVDAVKQQTSP